MKYCPNCNTENEPEARYCESCGHKLANTNVASLSGDSKTSSVNQTALVSSMLKAAAADTVGKVGLVLKRYLSKQDSTTPQCASDQEQEQSAKAAPPISPLGVNQLRQLLQEKIPQKPISPEQKRREQIREEERRQEQIHHEQIRQERIHQEQTGQQQLQEQIGQQQR